MAGWSACFGLSNAFIFAVQAEDSQLYSLHGQGLIYFPPCRYKTNDFSHTSMPYFRDKAGSLFDPSLAVI